MPAHDSSLIHHGGGKPLNAADPKIIAFFAVGSAPADYEIAQSPAKLGFLISNLPRHNGTSPGFAPLFFLGSRAFVLTPVYASRPGPARKGEEPERANL